MREAQPTTQREHHMIAPKISNPSKMPEGSWDLNAVKTCVGRKFQKGKRKGEVKPSCKTCYATKGNYRWKNTVALRDHNKEDWQREDWVDSMVAALAFTGYFRWFSSGDIYSEKLALKIEEVIKRTPEVAHWVPTQSRELPSIDKVLKRLDKQQNVAIRHSSGEIDGGTIRRKNSSTVICSDAELPEGAHHCPAPKQDNTCGRCRACWDKSIQVIAYDYH